MFATLKSWQTLTVGMLVLGVFSPVVAQEIGETRSANGEIRQVELPASAFEGIPHHPSEQGGSTELVMPTMISTEKVSNIRDLRIPFRPKDAPKHKVRPELTPGDSTAAELFQLSISDFYPQAIDPFRAFDAIGPNGLNPPDTNVGVGPDHIVLATNDDWAIYDRHGNEQYRVDIKTFLGTTDFMFDPRVTYDPWNGRFLLLYLRARGNPTGAGGSWWTLMISDDANPHGNWIIYDFNARVDGGTDVNQWVDFPHIGYDNEAVYLSGNMYTVNGNFRYGKVRILWKNQIYNGQGAAWWDNWNLPDTLAPAQGFRVLTAPRNHYYAQAPGGGGNYIRAYRIENPTAWHRGVGNPGLFHQADIGVGAFGPPPNAREPGRGRSLWTVDCRITDKSRLNYPFLYTCNHVGVHSGTAVGSKYYRLNVSNNTAPRDGLLFFTSVYDAFFPTLEATSDEDMALGLNASNGEAGSPYYVSLLAYEWMEGAAGIGNGILLRFGGGVAGGDRWGDYSASQLDPCDFKTVWVAGEHAKPGFWMTSAHEITLRKVRSNMACNNVTGRRGDNIALRATLTRADNNAGIAGAVVYFYVNGVYEGLGITDGSGVATRNYTVSGGFAPGDYPVVAEFNYCPGDVNYSWSRSTCSLHVMVENGDAGDLPETSQNTPGGALPIIDGIIDANDADMYAIFLANPAAFVATVVGGASFDTQLWLFDSAGKGVVFNDDSTGLQSRIDNTTGCLTGRPAGVYYLAISQYNRDALGCTDGLIFANSPFGTVRCPDGPEATSRVKVWSGGTTGGGVYTIFLTGAQGANRGDPADCCVMHNGDVDGNGCVNDNDLLLVLFNFGASGGGLGRVDINCDGSVNDNDLLIVLFNFGAGC